MYSLVFALFSVVSPIQLVDTGYFYFGNTNVIGVGLLSEGGKTGEWKVYSKINPDENPKNSLFEADPIEFAKEFNQAFPLFILNFEKGIPNGSFLENHPNGKPKVIANFKEGVFEGEFVEFYEDGVIRFKGNVSDGKKEGEWREFFPLGEIKISLSYSQGVLEGRSIGYFPQGKIEWEGNFKRGKLDGPYVSFQEDSTLEKKGQFANGVPVGEWIEKVKILPEFYRKGAYSSGFKDGEWHLTNLKTDFLQAEFYEKGKLISTGEFQLPDQVLDRGRIKNGNGQRYFYDEKGNVLAKGKISKGTANGTWYFYFPESDRVSASGRLDGSDRVGTWKFYSYQGEILDQTVYYKEPEQSANLAALQSKKRSQQDGLGGQQGTGIFGQGWDINTFQQNNRNAQFLK